MKKRIFQLRLALNAAAQDERWGDVKLLDRHIAALLTALREQDVTPDVLEQLAQLKKCHARVIQTCNEELDVLRYKLAQHQKNREGQQAYELFSEQGGYQ